MWLFYGIVSLFYDVLTNYVTLYTNVLPGNVHTLYICDEDTCICITVNDEMSVNCGAVCCLVCGLNDNKWYRRYV